MPATASRTISEVDRAVLDALARRGQSYVRIPEDLGLLQKALPPHESPRRRLSDMAAREQLARLWRGTYVVLPSGARSLAQAADHHLLISATFEGRAAYYFGFLSAISDHGLTDESVTELHVALGEGRSFDLKRLGARPCLTRMPFDARPEDSGEPSRAVEGREPLRGWLGVERLRIRGRMFYVRSGLERTLIDALDRPELSGRPEIWVRAWERAFREKEVDLALLLDLARRRTRAVAARAALLLRELGHVRESRLLVGVRSQGGCSLMLLAAETACAGPATDRPAFK